MSNTNKQEKSSVPKRSLHYTDKKRYILPLAMVFSALSGILVLTSMVYIHEIVSGITLSGSVDGGTIRYYAILAASFVAAGMLLYSCALMVSHLFAFEVEANIIKLSVKEMVAKPLGFFVNRGSGNLRKTIVDGAGETHTMLAYQLPDLAMMIVSPIVLLIFFFLFDWRPSLMSLVPMVITVLLMATMATPKSKKLREEYYEGLANLSAESVEYVRGIPVVRTFAQSAESSDRFYSLVVKLKDFVMRWSMGFRNKTSLYEVISNSTAFFLVPAAIMMITSGADMREVLGSSVIYLLIGPVFGVSTMRSASMQNFIYFVELVLDKIDTALDYEDLTYGETTAIGEGLEFRDVSFSYGKDKVLDNASSKVSKGETVVLVGASGGSKTTVARLAARFYDADEGDIFIGDISTREYKKEVLSQEVAFVFRMSKFFKMSLRENLLLDSPNASDEEIEQALVRTGAKEIVDNLEEGLDTIYDIKGTYFSGDEIQRLSIARAFLKSVDFMILDEATVFADPKNEHIIQASFKKLSKDKTTLVITYRLSTVINADRILVMENGKIVENGTHNELLTLGSVYKKLWSKYQKAANWGIGGDNE